jgi:hypothetical protein
MNRDAKPRPVGDRAKTNSYPFPDSPAAPARTSLILALAPLSLRAASSFANSSDLERAMAPSSSTMAVPM